MIEMRLSGLNDLKIIFTLVQSVRFSAKLSSGLLCGMANQALRVKLFVIQVELKMYSLSPFRLQSSSGKVEFAVQTLAVLLSNDLVG